MTSGGGRKDKILRCIDIKTVKGKCNYGVDNFILSATPRSHISNGSSVDMSWAQQPQQPHLASGTLKRGTLRFLRPNEAAEAAVPRTCPLMSHYKRDFWGGREDNSLRGIHNKTVRR